MALKVDIEAIGEHRLHLGQRRARLGFAPGRHQRVHRPVAAPGQKDEPFGVGDDLGPGHPLAQPAPSTSR